MKKASIYLTSIIFSLLTINMPVYADESATFEPTEQQTQQKNECILLTVQCGNSIISIQDKIQLLKEEIAKGRTTYTPEEIDKLKKKLEETSKTLDYLLDK